MLLLGHFKTLFYDVLSHFAKSFVEREILTFFLLLDKRPNVICVLFKRSNYSFSNLNSLFWSVFDSSSHWTLLILCDHPDSCRQLLHHELFRVKSSVLKVIPKVASSKDFLFRVFFVWKLDFLSIYVNSRVLLSTFLVYFKYFLVLSD